MSTLPTPADGFRFDAATGRDAFEPQRPGAMPDQPELPRGLVFESRADFLSARRSFLSEVAALPKPSRGYFATKRAIDITFALVIGILTLPIALVVAFLVKVHDRGPVFFAQQRTGLGGYRFRMLKFRTMCVNAEEMKAQLQHLSLVAYPDFKMDNDPRITPVGRFLRKTFLDELPQLINVLKGEMSIVGPRPTSFAASTYSLWHTERLDAKPGITGLWQVHRDPGENNFDQRLRLDVEYLRTRTTLGDLKLIMETVLNQFRRAGK